MHSSCAQTVVCYFFNTKCRFSDAGDTVLVSAGHRDMSLARTALVEGRMLVVFEPNLAKVTTTSEGLDALTGSAAKDGMWARMLSAPVVTVGPNRLPAAVPMHNFSLKGAEAVEMARQGGAEDPELKLASDDAGDHGLEIKVRVARTSICFCVCRDATRCSVIDLYFLSCYWQLTFVRLFLNRLRCCPPSLRYFRHSLRHPRFTGEVCSRKIPCLPDLVVSSTCL